MLLRTLCTKVRSSKFFLLSTGPQYNPWDVLNLRRGASTAELRDRYNDLMNKYNPTLAADGVGDANRMREVDNAYVFISQAPSNDKRYRNLLSDTQHFYYRLLPEWIARNLDEMPRYWHWARWRFSPTYFLAGAAVLCFIFGRIALQHPRWVGLAVFTLLLDCVFHTIAFPFVFLAILFRMWGEKQVTSLAWLQSPKNFLRRELNY